MNKHLPALRLLVAAFGLCAMSAFAKPVPDNLGNGLDKLVTNDLIQQGKITSAPATQTSATSTKSPASKTAKKSPARSTSRTATSATSTMTFDAYKSMVAKQAASYSTRALTDAATGNYL